MFKKSQESCIQFSMTLVRVRLDLYKVIDSAGMLDLDSRLDILYGDFRTQDELTATVTVTSELIQRISIIFQTWIRMMLEQSCIYLAYEHQLRSLVTERQELFIFHISSYLVATSANQFKALTVSYQQWVPLLKSSKVFFVTHES